MESGILAAIEEVVGGEVQRENVVIVKQAVERDVLKISSGGSAYAVSIFKPGNKKSVNTNLHPQYAAEKCYLAQKELSNIGIPTAKPIGIARWNKQACLVSVWIQEAKREPGWRIMAAKTLALLHSTPVTALSKRLRLLIRMSDPRMERTTQGLAPRPVCTCLVHGDYFSKNILSTGGQIFVIDWETVGMGDPMWDLGFLLGADRGLSQMDRELALEAYQLTASVDFKCLDWHVNHWNEFWKRRSTKNALEVGGEACRSGDQAYESRSISPD